MVGIPILFKKKRCIPKTITVCSSRRFHFSLKKSGLGEVWSSLTLFTTGNKPGFGEKLLGNSIRRGFGAPEGLNGEPPKKLGAPPLPIIWEQCWEGFRGS